MPELPDITVYVEALEQRVKDATLTRVDIFNPFLLRTAVPPLRSVFGKQVTAVQRLGKRIVLGLEGDYWLVLHLMIAGRLHWAHSEQALVSTSTAEPKGRAALLRKNALAAFTFSTGTLKLTEAATRKRASLHLLQGIDAFRATDPGGMEVLGSKLEDFARVLTSRNHTLKRALTDPRLFSGIGNAYSDEILHRARLSPVALTQKLSDEKTKALHAAVQEMLAHWTAFLRNQTGDAFPEHVTAFRPEMAVHGKFGQPCPVCGAKVQRIRYAENETNYCPGCQTEGRLLADRALSQLLKKDWPRTPEELEELKTRPGLRH